MGPPAKYKKYLSEHETVNGEPTNFVITAKNIGNESTPEGELRVSLERPAAMTLFSIMVKPFKLPVLQPKKTFSVKGKATLLAPGLWFLCVNAVFQDKKKVEYYSSDSSEPYPDRWTWPIYVIERGILDSNILLNKLIEEREK